MMREDVFGHRITSYSPKDTMMLKNKVRQPTTDAEKSAYVDMIEPMMKRKTYISPDKDAFLDSFVDLDTRVSQHDFLDTDDEGDELDYLFGGMDDIIDEE